MINVVGVSFRHSGKVYYYNPNGYSLSSGDHVIVKSANGLEFGDVDQPPMDLPKENITQPLKKIIRLATTADEAELANNQAKEREAFKKARERIAEFKLDMRLIRVELLFDRSKMTFYFSSEERIDFRELVKDLAGIFKTRIELRQLGVRDKAKMLGGLGHCGQRLCCTVFLNNFNPVSIRMAKAQSLNLNPQKISGVCGRLMCCLRYEYTNYRDFNKLAPKKGTMVETAAGERGKVININAVKEKITIKNKDGIVSQLSLEELHGCGCEQDCQCQDRDKKNNGKAQPGNGHKGVEIRNT